MGSSRQKLLAEFQESLFRKLKENEREAYEKERNFLEAGNFLPISGSRIKIIGRLRGSNEYPAD